MTKKPKSKNRRKARAWMVLEGIRQVHIKKALQYKHDTQVNETLQGHRNDRRVLRYLLDKGCPPEYLALPPGMLGGTS